MNDTDQRLNFKQGVRWSGAKYNVGYEPAPELKRLTDADGRR